MEVNLQIVIGVVIISLLFFIIHPLRYFLNIGTVNGNEGFDSGSKPNVEYSFSGTRWNSDKIRTFRETVQTLVSKFSQLQTDLYMTLQEYRSLDGSLLEGAKTKKAEIVKNEEQLQEASTTGPIPGLITSDPVESYYKPFVEAKKNPKSQLPLGATTEISTTMGLQYELPQIVLPDTTTLTNIEEYRWVDMPDGKDRYEKEQRFYTTVSTIIPIIQKSIGELYINANLLRISAGSKTYSLLPRVEAIQKEIEEQEKSAKMVGTQSSEGFQASGSKQTVTETEICKKGIMYQAEDYSKWETKLKDSKTVILQVEDLIQKAEGDIKIAKRIMENIRKKGEEQRAKIRKLRKSRIE
jgi:hypothetical protein